MPLAMLEGFDYYPADVGAPGVGVGISWIGSNAFHNLVEGRFEAKAYVLSGAGFGHGSSVRVLQPTTNGKLGFGAAMKPQNVAAFQSFQPRAMELTTPTDSNAAVLTVCINEIGQVTVFAGRFDEGHLIGLCPRSVLSQTWHYIECELIIHATDGRCKFYIDGEVQFDKTGINTLIAGRTQVGRWQVHVDNQNSCVWDDIYYIADEDETLGESRIQLLQPLADEEITWTPQPAGGGNFANIDDGSTDGDGTYNFTNVVGNRDWFSTTAISVNPDTIHAIGVVMASKKVDSGTRIIVSSLRSGSSVEDSPNHTQTSDYTWSRDIFLTDPNGDVAWTKDSVNALDVGYKLVL